MKVPSVAPHTWTEHLRYVTDPAAQRSLAGKSLVVAIACLLGIAAGIGFIAVGWAPIGWTAIGLAVVAILVWLAIAANARAASKMTGDDLIEIVIADEGVLVQGGLPILWSEISDVKYTWNAPVTFTGGLGAHAANGIGTLLDKSGIDASMKTITLELRDHEAVKARATTKARKMVLFAPMLGSAATVHVGLNGRTDDEVYRALQLLGAAAAQHGISFTRNA